MPLTRAQVALMSEKARRTPPAPPAEANVTKQEAVRLLAPDIAGLRSTVRASAGPSISESWRVGHAHREGSG